MSSLSPSLPTILLVPGAWHSPTHYSTFLSALTTLGYPTVCERNPSCDSSSPHTPSTADDASAIRALILTQLDAGHEVVVALHSYGGCPGGAAAKGLSKQERLAAGEPGGVIGLVFICAFVANEGDSLIGKLPGGVPTEWMILHVNCPHPSAPSQPKPLTQTPALQPDGNFFPFDPKAVFYADIPSPTDSIAISQLRLQSAASMNTPSPPPAWADKAFDGRRAYVHCTQDQAIPAVAQTMMVEGSGVEWVVRTMESAHSPFLSDPEQLAGLVRDFVGIFRG